MRTLLLILATLAMMACASPDYAKYADANQAIETARHQADAAKYKAMADIAAQGDSSAKVAAVMAIAMGSQAGAAPGTNLAAPAPNAALQWASILVPSLTQVVGMKYNYLANQTASNNAASVAISTNSTFAAMGKNIGSVATTGVSAVTSIATAGNTSVVDMAKLIQSPAANISTVTTTNTSTDTHAVDNHAVTTTTTTPAPVVIPQANISTVTSMSGTGVLGSGSYTASPTTTTLSGTGTLGSGAYSTQANPVSTIANPVTNNSTSQVPAGTVKVCATDTATGKVNCQ